jgi:hypothetical protein
MTIESKYIVLLTEICACEDYRDSFGTLEHFHRFDFNLKSYTGMIAHLSREFSVVAVTKLAGCWTPPAMTLLVNLTLIHLAHHMPWAASCSGTAVQRDGGELQWLGLGGRQRYTGTAP